MKKTKTAALALAAVLSLSACGANTETGGTAAPSTASAAAPAETTPSSASESATSPTSEAAPEPDPLLYDYYKELSAEYAADGRKERSRYSSAFGYGFHFYDDNLLIYYNNNVRYIYNISDKESKEDFDIMRDLADKYGRPSSFFGAFNGRLYYVSDYDAPNGSNLTDEDVFCYDGTQWIQEKKDDRYDYLDSVCGKYIKTSKNTVVNCETGEETAALNNNYASDFWRTYFGGDYNIMLYDGAWYKVQIPSDGSEVDWSQYQPLGKESGVFSTGSDNNIAQLNDTYYLFVDDYGMFLRTYEKGEAEEETVCLFEN